MSEPRFIDANSIPTRICTIIGDDGFEFETEIAYKFNIDDAPTADVAPVIHGEWIYDHWCEFKCSNCGHWSNSQPYKGREKYCPNCGVKMKGTD